MIVPTPEPVTPPPTPTATRVLDESQQSNNFTASDGDSIQASVSQPNPAQEAQLVAPGAVNIRSGPGLNYNVIGTLNANTAMPVVGRNASGSWWQIKTPNDGRGWVANSVVNATHIDGVAVAQAPPPPEPAAVAAQPAADTSPPPEPQPTERPKYQYEPTGWYDDGNAGLTRFMGDIKDIDGNPVNGAFVQASCGNFSVISYPSGPVGWGGHRRKRRLAARLLRPDVNTRPVPVSGL